MAREMLRMSQFRGINVDDDETLLDAADLVKADNAEIVDNGKLAKCQGTEFVNKASLAGKVIQMFEWARDDGTVLRFGRVYKEADGFGKVSLVRFMDDGTTKTIYETSVEIKSNYKATFTAGTATTLDSGYNNCKVLISDGTYLYLFLHTSIQQDDSYYSNITVLKLDIATLTVQASYSQIATNSADSDPAGITSPVANKMILHNDYLFIAFIGYAPGGTGGARVIRLNADTLTEAGGILLQQAYYKDSTIDIVPIDNYVYVFTSRIFKLNATTFMLEYTSDDLYGWTLGNGLGLYSSVVKYDDDYFYIAFNTSPAQVYKVSRITFRTESKTSLPSGCNGCYGATMVVIDSVPYMYIGTNTASSNIVKVNLKTMEVVNSIKLDSGLNYCRDMIYDSSKEVIYAAMAASPGKVVVVDPSTLKVVYILTLSSGQDNCFALMLLNNILCIGLTTSPAQILQYSVTITSDSTVINVDTSNKKSGFFSLLDVFYMLTGIDYLKYDGNTITKVTEETTDDQGQAVTDCDLDPIRACTMAVWHPTSFRVFFAVDGSNKLYYSEKNDPRWVKKTGYVVPTTGDGPIKGLGLSMDAVVVFFQRGAWVWNGQDPASDATWKRLPLTEGTESPATIENGTNQMEWLGTGSGYWGMAPAMLGATTVLNPSQSLLANLAEKKVTNYLKNIKNRELACSAYDTRERKCYIAYCDDSSLGYCNKMLIRNTDIPGSFTRLVGQQIYDLLYTSSGELWIATENYIVKRQEHYKQALSDGTYGAISMDIKTPGSVLGNPYREKQVHSLSVGFLNPGAGYELNVTLYVDDVAVFTTTYITTADEGSYIMARFTDIYDAIGTRFSVEITNNQVETKTVIYEIALQHSLASNYGQSI